MHDEKQVRDIIAYKLNRLPTLPEVVRNIMTIVRDERSTAAQLAGYIEHDQSICAAVLRVANSAYYGAYRKVDSIGRAIVVLGFDQVRSIALSTGVFAKLGQARSGHFSRREFWLHSIGVATGSKMVARQLGHNDEFFFVCGLIHDIGKLLFAQHMAQEYARVIRGAESGRRPLWEVERQHFGLDHTEVGQLMLERWKLPQHLISGLRYHHAWEGSNSVPEAAQLVALADNLCLEARIGGSGAPRVGLDLHLGQQLGFSADDLRDLCDDLAAQQGRIEEFLDALE